MMLNRYFEVNEEKHNIRCKIYYNDFSKVKKVVIFCHGFGGHKDNGAAAKFAEWVLSKYKGIAVVTFNWPCHGDDVKKKIFLDDHDSYLRLLIDYVKVRFETEDIYAYGTSYGGYLILRYLHKYGNPFSKIALRCPAINIYESMTERIMKKEEKELLERGKEVLIGFDRKVPVTPEYLEALKTDDIRKWDFLDFADDIIIMHGRKDEIISFDVVQQFADDNVIEFVPIDNADHRFQDPQTMITAIKTIIAFFDF